MSRCFLGYCFVLVFSLSITLPDATRPLSEDCSEADACEGWSDDVILIQGQKKDIRLHTAEPHLKEQRRHQDEPEPRPVYAQVAANASGRLAQAKENASAAIVVPPTSSIHEDEPASKSQSFQDHAIIWVFFMFVTILFGVIVYLVYHAATGRQVASDSSASTVQEEKLQEKD
eukprot:gnl/TRDRNA2_/TRDRNA2_35040_c0_seq1.p1 gnl/TRDRNA2_/TRDRNA2_35040_c0~~gnl/TRDRNA2_/TRDRNA2_35040_c0_seq1.p1  ORF type:complete len:173 (-),score=30.38 gnl/TRDRNA2_/TRDRNA2_35040_c0_seq1:95-613(-)